MSAPVSHDPLVVNTQDGSCWTRRALTRSGGGLYALAEVRGDVPDLVLVTLKELAEIGLRSMADALPMPAGPVLEAPVEDVTAQVRKLRNLLAGQRAAVEDPHDSPLHHAYRVPRDLPELGGAR